MRTAIQNRKTKETDISVRLNLDGGPVEISTGIGFFDHMLEAFAVHGGFGLSIGAEGDLFVDCHHTVEDTGIVLGKAFAQALGDKSGIKRYGSFWIPMDESLCSVHVDVSGRPFLVFRGTLSQERVGDFDTCMTSEFLRAFATNAGITLHAEILYGENAHHEIEGIFKALGHALHEAFAPYDGTLSTKGKLDS